MGETHWRSDIREYGAARTASFSTFQGNLTGNVTGNVTGNITGEITASNYIKLGSIYVISGDAGAACTNASINAAASTLLSGAGVATKGDIPQGTLFINTQTTALGSELLLVQAGLASWMAPTGVVIGD